MANPSWVPDFLTWLAAVARENGKTPDEISQLWKKYAADCRNFDQSATQPEFLRWNDLIDPEAEPRDPPGWEGGFAANH